MRDYLIFCLNNKIDIPFLNDLNIKIDHQYNPLVYDYGIIIKKLR
jgi:hypothetical protein